MNPFAVGDAAFRLKCMKIIRDKLQCGMAIIFVSHQTAQIADICDQAVRLDQGRIRQSGSCKDVCPTYEKYTLLPVAGENRTLRTTFYDSNAGARFLSVSLGLKKCHDGFDFTHDEAISIQFLFETQRRFESLFFNFVLRTIDDVMIFGAREPIAGPCTEPNRYTLEWRLPPGFLIPGIYKLETRACPRVPMGYYDPGVTSGMHVYGYLGRAKPQVSAISRLLFPSASPPMRIKKRTQEQLNLARSKTFGVKLLFYSVACRGRILHDARD